MVSSPIQLIDSKGHFNKNDLKSFVAKTKFSDSGKSYSVVSIVGPKSSGKSTLLNQLFGTNFKVGDTFGQPQTTQGIWMAKVDRIEPFTIAMDISGTDGRVKKGNTTFDKQSALFTFEISDVILINMWWHDLGRDEAACRPLLKIIFQFMVQHFEPRKRTLLFVLRDKKTTFSFKDMKGYLKDDIKKIWDGVPKPDAHKNTPLKKFFKVEIIALPSCDHNEKFEQEVAALKPRFFSSTSTSQGGQVAADRRVVSASDFSNQASEIWKRITQIPDLKISSVQVMVSTIRCDEIIKHKLDALSADLSAAKLDKPNDVGPQEFATGLRSILEACFSDYDKETKYYDEVTRTAKREVLEVKALERLRPAYDGMLKHLFVKAFKSFSTGLVEILEKGIDEKKDFAASVDTLEKSCVREFKKGCKGIGLVFNDESHYNSSTLFFLLLLQWHCFLPLADAALGRANWDASPYQETLVQTMMTVAPWVKNQAKSQGNSAPSASTAVSGLAAVSAIAQAVASGAGLASVLAKGGNCNLM